MKFADQIAKALRIRIDVDVTPARAFVVGAILGGLLAVPMLDELSAAERFVLLAAQSLIVGGVAAHFTAERERQTAPGHRSVRLLCSLVSLVVCTVLLTILATVTGSVPMAFVIAGGATALIAGVLGVWSVVKGMCAPSEGHRQPERSSQ